MHPQGVLPMGPLPMGAPQQQQQAGRGPSSGSSSGAPDLLTSLKPCKLPEDMPLPVSSRKAAAAAAAENDDEEDSGGFDWKGLARSSQQPRKQQQPRNASDAVAKASQRIAVITGGGGSQSAGAGAAAAAQQHSSQKREPERQGPQEATDNLGRRVWDKEYYEEKAKEKASLLGVESFLDLLPKPREKPKPPPLPPCGYRQQLQQRTFKLDFEREVGRTKMVTLQTPRMQQGGFWCDICECLCKDSQAYLDHINGRNHNRLLGMSMRVERVPLARVKAKLQAARQTAGTGWEPPNPKTKADAPVRQQQQQQQGGGAQGTSGGFGALAGGAGAEGGAAEAEDEFERVKRRLEELQREQELKKQRKKEKKRAAAAAAGGTTPAAKVATPANTGLEANPDAAALAAMGLPTSFSGC
ncbi:C2H2-type zinc finger-containing protein, related [Eimeria acervulina]|uniref:C2H2-type zinc finger-containing protein, related n=1 Tax=Eimeria acervulina TaxID=5801 RepID=U6GIB3_EIMAC|nr:C2H2-type zinc finger-containing protein, related [Eimeria acervulina]CDI79307.1 C2H2-type zinc finger-containing protein, related [Eimeria acervulina]